MALATCQHDGVTLFTDADLPILLPGASPDTATKRAAFDGARHTGPLARGLFGPIALRHADVVELLRDRRMRGPGMDFARLSGVPEDSRTWARMQQILLFMEGDDHHRLRRLVAKAFTPGAVEALRPFTRATIARLVDAVVDDGRCDAATALCDPYPVPIICALVGVDHEHLADMTRWASAILLSLSPTAGQHMDQLERVHAELDEHVSRLIEQRRIEPRDDLLSRLIAAEEAGDRLSSSELLSVVTMMLVAGTDTTRNQLSNMIHTFAEHPDQWEILRERPELVANAVEEAIRWEPATEALPRMTLEDIEIGGHVVPANTLVLLMSMSANHDESALPGAGSFDITRETPAGWHLLTFGGGVHYCLGANLARMELVEALAELSSRLPSLRLDGDAVLHPPPAPISGYRSLPIAWG